MAQSNSLPALIGAAAAAMAQELSDQQIALLSAVFTQLGDSLAVIAAARTLSGPAS